MRKTWAPEAFCLTILSVVTQQSPLEYYSDSELVFALVAPVGTDLDQFQGCLEALLRQFGYGLNPVRLSQLAVSIIPSPEPPQEPYVDRLNRLMDVGNKARLQHGGDILGLAAAAEISSERPKNGQGNREPRGRTAYLLRSLKHPGEVQALRRVYGAGFYLVGVVAPESQRKEFLKSRKGCSDEEIAHLLERDEHEEHEYGQQTRETFHLADVFVPLGDEKALRRFLDVVFGCPTKTPTADEYAMFMAFAAALRSADLSRQVGAVITTEHGDLVALGANDVPKPHGGLYWPGPNEQRDHAYGFDPNQQLRQEIIDEILASIRPQGADAEAWKTSGWQKLRGSKVMDITEYGRAVHAEMEALLSCARCGVSPRGGTLFTTTFPCHNCAKHIIAAGIRRVVYVEPYPKSHAMKLYENEIEPGPVTEDTDKVVFEAFVGIGPRRFFDLFSICLSTGYPVKRKEDDGRLRQWQPSSAEARVAMLPTSYIVREQAAADKLLSLRQREDRHGEDRSGNNK